MNTEINKAEQLLNNGKTQEAIRFCQTLLAQETSCAEQIYYQLGQAFSATEQWQSAADAYLQALNLKPNFAIAAIGLGDAAVALKAYPEAEKAYSRALYITPLLAAQIGVSFKHFADSLVTDKQYKIAIMAYFNAFNLDHFLAAEILKTFNKLKKQREIKKSKTLTDSIQKHIQKIRVIQQAEEAEKSLNWAQAIQCWENAIKENPTEESAYEHLWFILQHQKKLQDAQHRYQQSIIQSPNNPVLHVQLGGVLARLNTFSEALLAYQNAKQLKFYPNWLHKRIVDSFIELDQLEDAKQEVQHYFNHSTQKTQVLAGLAHIATCSQQFELALQHRQAIRKAEPHSISAFLGEAHALFYLKRYEEAKERLNTALTESPNNPQVLGSLALWAQQQEDWQNVLHYYALQLKQQPDNPDLKVEKANALMKLHFYDEAQQIYKELEKQYPHSFQGLYGLAQMARWSNDFQQCIDYAKKLIENYPGLPIGYREAEQAYIEIGEFKRANEMFLARPGGIQTSKTHLNTVDLPEGLILPDIKGKNNDYTFIEERLETFIASRKPYTLAVSIIIPVYNRKTLLAKTLAALTHQTYPKQLIEVIVADDGSSDGVEKIIFKYRTLLNLKYVSQADEGFRLSAVRNLGMRIAKHDYFIILDCDALPVPQLVESYMQFFHVSDRVAMMGPMRFVCSNDISDDDILNDINRALNLPDIKSSNDVSAKSTTSGVTYDWRLPIWNRTNKEKNQRWPFMGFVGANMVHSRAAFDEVGGYDEDFQAWGHEDTEMGYRLYNAGYYFIPVMPAMVLHQEPLSVESDSNRQTGKRETATSFEEKCPVSIYRTYQKDKVYEIPKVSLYIPAYNAAKYIKAAVDSALNQTYTDLEVCICDDGSTDNTLELLEQTYGHHPRVRWFSQANGGTAKASNMAVRLCRGMYIGQLDADDVLKPNAVELAVNYLDNHDVGFVYSACDVINADGQFVRLLNHSHDFSHGGLLYGNIVGPFRFYRKRDWMRANGFSEDLITTEDYDLALKMAEVCDFHYINDVNYSYRWHGENTSVVKRKQQEADHFLVINRALERMGLTAWEAVPADEARPRLVKLQQKIEKTPQNISIKDLIVLIPNCEKYAWKADGIRNTWINDFKQQGGRYYFLRGNPKLQQAEIVGDVLYVPCRDDYESLLLKLVLAYQVIYEDFQFSHICKMDDDIFLNLDNFKKEILPQLEDNAFLAGQLIQKGNDIDTRWHIGKCSDDRFHVPLSFKNAPCDCADGGCTYFIQKSALPYLIKQTAQFKQELNDFIYSLEDVRVSEILNANSIAVKKLKHFIAKKTDKVYPGTKFTIAFDIHTETLYSELYQLVSNQRLALPTHTQPIVAMREKKNALNFDSILIITYARSGSTLLQGLLNSIPGCLIRGENNNLVFDFFQGYKKLIHNKQKKYNQINPTNPWYGASLPDEELFLSHIRHMVHDLLLADKLSNPDISCYGFKEIRYIKINDELVEYLDFLNKVFPKVAFIFNTRNVDDVINSGKQVFQGWKQKDAEDIRATLYETEQLFKQYAQSHHNCFQIRYEDVIANNNKVCELFKFIGAEYSVEKIDGILKVPHSYAPTQKNIQTLMFQRDFKFKKRLSNFIYVKNYNFIFCYTPKIACTGFKHAIRALEGLPTITKDIHDKDETTGLSYLHLLPEEEAFALLSDPKVLKAVFVRNPYSRILSAFLDKLKRATTYTTHENRATGLHICKQLNIDFSEYHPETFNFEDFIHYLSITDNEYLDEHFTAQTFRSCFEEGVKFDFIGHFETLEQDIERLEKLIGRPIPFLSQKQQSEKKVVTNATCKLEGYYTEELRKKVANRFEKDFVNFSYTFGLPKDKETVIVSRKVQHSN